jgi:DNA-binding NarL/FixJ family response regulator
MKILLVDDDVFLRDMYATKFTEHGDVVESAENSEEAIRMVTANTYDVVLTDMVMPGTSGVELIKKIRTIDSAKKSHCIVLSNQGEESDIDSAKKAGALGYIIKAEVVPSEVVERVHQLVS